MNRLLRRAFREPLLHFVLLGALLFIAYSVWGGSAEPATKRIELSADDVQQLKISFAAQWERAPSTEQLQGLLESKVREEILYREALALGLDKGDEIVKRRLAQKMQFLAEDLAGSHQPTTGELKAWFARNAKGFEVAGRISFRHIYFSPDRRGQHAHDDALAALTKVTAQPGTSMAVELGDRFMFQDYYSDRAAEQINKDFGATFAEALSQLKPGSWQGPIESGYGWHLVYVDAVTPGHLPPYEEVESDVRSAWLAEQKATAWNKAYAAMRARYAVTLPPASRAQPASASIPSADRKSQAVALAGPE